eukprot:1801564-Amphidinium_carterae.1
MVVMQHLTFVLTKTKTTTHDDANTEVAILCSGHQPTLSQFYVYALEVSTLGLQANVSFKSMR